ncbi:MAG: hypothetical protein PF447_06220 [Spirochaetaceae bacterium]|jgi:hypothetical protein|nr:hypothetical protein [Spirochaetaceae bacterium]
MKYNKLIRDRIPEIIQASGKKAHVVQLSEEGYKKYLYHKLLGVRFCNRETLGKIGSLNHGMVGEARSGERKGKGISTTDRHRWEWGI